MILGMTTATYTLIHVIISLVGIASGLVVAFGLMGGKRLDGWTALFLVSTVATSVTGFGFRLNIFRRLTKSASYRWWCWRSRFWPVTDFTLPELGAGST